VSFQVIEHIEDDKLFLKEINRVLKPGGLALAYNTLTGPYRFRGIRGMCASIRLAEVNPTGATVF
jgi:ubiquinone/menaquinone biosynthesis C-methylase UbiE